MGVSKREEYINIDKMQRHGQAKRGAQAARKRSSFLFKAKERQDVHRILSYLRGLAKNEDLDPPEDLIKEAH